MTQDRHYTDHPVPSHYYYPAHVNWKFIFIKLHILNFVVLCVFRQVLQSDKQQRTNSGLCLLFTQDLGNLKKHSHLVNSGHPGCDKTQAKIQERFYWPTSCKGLTDYVKTCHVCQKINKAFQKNRGIYQPQCNGLAER